MSGDRAAAQATPGVAVAGLEHHPDGHVLVSLRITDPNLDLRQASVMVDGQPRPATSTVADKPKPVAVVMAIDTSDSMRGAPLAFAQQAARTLLGRFGPSDQVALVTFSDAPRVVVPLSSDRVQIGRGIDGMSAGGPAAPPGVPTPRCT